MPLLLGSLFRPKWQSAHASTRLKAAARLNPASSVDSVTLKQLALCDSSTEVRLLAMQRSNDPELLLRLSKQEANSQVKTHACRLLCELITRNDDELSQPQLLALLSGVKQIDLLIHIALNARQQPVRRYAVDQLEDEAALEQVVKFSKDSQQQLIAAQAIEDPLRLRQLLQHAETVLNTDKTELIQLLQQRLMTSSRAVGLSCAPVAAAAAI